MNKLELSILLEKNNKTLQSQGFIVLDDVGYMPKIGEPTTTQNLVIGLNTRGLVRLEYDTKPAEFREHDICILMPRHVIKVDYISDDYQMMVIIVSPESLEQMKNSNLIGYQENIHYHWQPRLHLEEGQFRSIHALFCVLHSMCWQESKHKQSLFANLWETLFSLLQDYREANGISVHLPSPHEHLFARFTDAIAENYRKSREVRFYANLFCLSPKHFASIIKQQTGKNASEWITSYVITQAKALLLYQSQFSIQQISFSLGFPDQASFSRYFKTNTGMSPRGFRDMGRAR